MKHIMIDTETWGLWRGHDARSIGACVMDANRPHTEWDTFYVCVDNPTVEPHPDAYLDGVGNYRKYPLTRLKSTVDWWSQQSQEAQEAFNVPHVDLREGLIMFNDWVINRLGLEGSLLLDEPMMYQTSELVRFWSHGAAYDQPIMSSWYEATGVQEPWHYRSIRDTRTLFDLADIVDHTAFLADRPGPLGINHHALDDAICQGRAVVDAMTML